MGQQEQNSYWGYHLVIDAAQCDVSSVTDPNKITDFAKTLVNDIDMVAYGEPQVVHFAKHDPQKAGYTLVQLIETSNITAHFLDINGDAYFDVFSCKPFDVEVVKKLISDYFKPKKITERYFTRKAPTVVD